MLISLEIYEKAVTECHNSPAITWISNRQWNEAVEQCHMDGEWRKWINTLQAGEQERAPLWAGRGSLATQ